MPYETPPDIPPDLQMALQKGMVETEVACKPHYLCGATCMC